jgi:antitoxin component YwqK of YwqJK toxin-antitoxin module
MKKKLLGYVCCFVLLTCYQAFSQSAGELNSIKVIEKGIGLYDDKKYDEAIIEYKKISRSDSNYVLAATELAATYVASGKDSLAVELCSDLLKIPSSYIPKLLALKGNALDNVKKPDEAIKVYEEGIKKFPLYYTFTTELGILKMRQEKYKEAYDWFVKSAKVNPYHASTHYYLGYIAARQGKQVPAMLAWMFYLTLDNSSDRAQKVVATLEKMAKNEYTFDDIIKAEGLEEQDDFSELEALVKSRVALDKKYKSETRLNFNITKQIQLVMEKMEIAKGDKGFFMQFYAPFYLELYKKKMLEPFSYTVLAGVENKEVDSWVKKNSDKIHVFASWVVDYLSENISYYEENLNGQLIKAHHYYSNTNDIVSVGNHDAKNQNAGYWNYYYSNGIKKSEGGYNDKNQRHGVWKFYREDGLTDATENYVNGVAEGQIETYYTNGSIESRKNFAKNLLEGEQLVFYPTGVLKKSYQFKADVENGKEKHFHPNGKTDYEINVVNGKYEGDLIQYYMDGHIKQKSFFKEGKMDGKYVQYYDIPANVISEEEFYEKGVITGIYKTYYKNGKLSETGEFNKDGEKTGVWKNYSEDNVLISEETFNKGKNSGTSKNYDNKGVLTEEFIYKNDMLQEYKAYAKDGKTIYQNKKEGKNNYDVLLYRSNGNKKKEGYVKNGQLDGKWKYYNVNGYLVGEDNYVNGFDEGKSYTYHENGKIKSETEYVKGKKNGYYKSYFRNGAVQQEGGYLDGEAVGEWKYYYPDGTKQSVNFYKDGAIFNWQQYYCANGKLDYEDMFEFDYATQRIDYDSLGKRTQVSQLNKGTGVLDIKFPDGKQYWKVNYVNGLKQGEYNCFFPNGKISVTKKFIDDEVNGELKTFYPSGQLKSSGKYINGDIDGKFINYLEDGTVESSFEYVNGKETGKSYTYYPNKQIRVDYSYKNDELDGKTISYTETGDLIILKNFEDGVLVSYQYNDKTGALCAPIEVKNETGTIKAYFKSGTPSLEYALKNGALEGKRVQYFPDGKVAEESYFTMNDREGARKVYYPSGKLKQVENWKFDLKVGPCITYHENGKIKLEEFYINGKKFGPEKTYDEKGVLVNTYFYYDDELIK